LETVDLERLRARDPELLEALVRDTSPRMLAVIRPYARDEHHAKDLLQDCWIHILERLEQFRRCDSFGGWAVAVSKNVCRMQYRQAKRTGTTVAGSGTLEGLAGAVDPLEESMLQQQRQVLFAALGKLPDIERTAIVMRLLEGRSRTATAEILHVTVSMVGPIVARGISRLRGMEEVRQLLLDWIEPD